MSFITPANGATFSIGAASDTPPGTASAAGALTGFVPVRRLESIGDFGDTAQSVTFTALEDSRVTKVKGARDAGDMTISVAYLAGDPGQAAMDAAELTATNYNFKVTLNDMPINGMAPTTTYLFGMVTGNKRQYGAANQVTKISYTVALNAAPIEIQAH